MITKHADKQLIHILNMCLHKCRYSKTHTKHKQQHYDMFAEKNYKNIIVYIRKIFVTSDKFFFAKRKTTYQMKKNVTFLQYLLNRMYFCCTRIFYFFICCFFFIVEMFVFIVIVNGFYKHVNFMII